MIRYKCYIVYANTCISIYIYIYTLIHSPFGLCIVIYVIDPNSDDTIIHLAHIANTVLSASL